MYCIFQRKPYTVKYRTDIVLKEKIREDFVMRETWKEWIKTLATAFGIIAVLFVFLWPVNVEGPSMEQTLQDGDRIVMSRFCAWTGKYNKGDIVVFRWKEGEENIMVVKRIIAMAGDTVEIHDDQLLLNASPQQEEYIQGKTEGNLSLTVPEGQIFVMGDNRQFSYDSRGMGTIAEKDIVGKVVFRWFPVERIQLFSRINTGQYVPQLSTHFDNLLKMVK